MQRILDCPQCGVALVEGRVPVPERDDSVGQPALLVSGILGPGQAKVSDLQAAAVVHQQVGGLQVPVQDVVQVAVVQPLEQLLHVAFDLPTNRQCQPPVQSISSQQTLAESKASTTGRNAVQSISGKGNWHFAQRGAAAEMMNC